MAQNSISSELNDLLITHDFDVDALSTKTGRPAVNERGVPDSSEADMFSFDWVGPTGKNYGTMVILLDQNGGMTVYFGDNLGRTMEPEDKKAWYGDPESGSTGFLEQLKNFAIRTSKIRGGFGLENLSKLKYAIAGQAALTESFYGTRKVSYSGEPTQARLMIKHTRPIAEGDKRYRYVESLFIETAEGERFRLPFRKLAGGRAMLEHVRHGGNPYDLRGQHISETVNQLNVLSQFRRAHQGRVFEGAAGDLVTETDQYYQRLNHNLKHMATGRGYDRYFESWKPADISEGDIMVEDLRGMFVETRIDPRIESALPMLAKIQQEAKAMKEADIFESWAARLVEGTWALPDTPEKMTRLKDWLSQPRPLGPDAENVMDVLYDLIGDDALFDQLSAMAAEDPDADSVPMVQAWVTRNKDQSPELSELAASFETAAPTAPPAPAAPAAPAAAAPPAAPAVPAPVAENLNAFRRLAGMSESLVDQSSDETMDDPDQDDKIANFQKIGQPMNAVVGSQRTTTDTGNGNPDFQERIASVTGPDGQGMYKVTVINNDDISSSYLTKNPPRNPQFFGKDVDEGDNLETFEDIIRLSGAPINENVLNDSGSTLDYIIKTYQRDVKDFVQNGDMSEHLFDALYDYYLDDMPYGVKKARSGDPYEWIGDRFSNDLQGFDMVDEADYGLGYQDNQLPFVDPRASYVMPANAAEREQDVKDFGHLTKNQNLGNPASPINKNVTPSTKTVPFGQNNRTTASYVMPANAGERAADLKDYGPLTNKFNLGSNPAPAMEDRTFDAELARIKSLSSLK
jgi:hypothetical protein